MKKQKIITWNVNGLRAIARKGAFDELLNLNADVYCLQETKAEADQLTEGVRNPEDYFSYFNSSQKRKGYSGVAIYSKREAIKVEYGMHHAGKDELDKEGRLLAAHFEDMIVITGYFPNGGSGPDRLAYKLEFYDAFLTYIEDLRSLGKPVIFCGDVNTAHEAIDLARPKANEKNTGFLPEERAWIDEVIGAGWVDVFRHFYPHKTDMYTYWDMKTAARERNVGWRIDYFFAEPKMLSKTTSAKILTNFYGSDHCPMEVIVGK